MIGEKTRIRSNDVRKAGIAVLEESDPDPSKRRKLAKSMTHQQGTSVKFYERFQRDIEDAEIQNNMEDIFGNFREHPPPQDSSMVNIQNNTDTTVPPNDTAENDLLATPRRRTYNSWTANDANEIENIVSSSPPGKLRLREDIVNITPTHLQGKYGIEKCVSKVRRIMLKTETSTTSLLPSHLQLKRKRKQGSITEDDENILYTALKSHIEKTASEAVFQ